MVITFEQAGGFAAGMRRPAWSIDSSTLSSQQRRELEELVQSLIRSRATLLESDERLRDSLTFKITLTIDGDVQVFRQTDINTSEEFEAVRAWIERHHTRSH